MSHSSAINGFGKKEDLVERVIESIKTLTKKEEEIKVSSTSTASSKPVKKNGEVLNFKNNNIQPHHQ